MQPDRRGTKKMNTSSSIWPIVLLLLLFTIATGALLASILKSTASGEKNVIALFPTKAVESSAMEVSYVPAKVDPEIEAFDDQSKWETSTDIDLFKTSYLGTDGEITVKSENRDKIIAPGTTNSYRFSLKNTGNVSLNYKMNLDGVFELGKKAIPFEVRLSKGDKWIVGGKDEWSTLDELNSVVEKAELGVGKYVIYTLEWQWPFENDEADMALLDELNADIAANNRTTMDANFELSINTISEATPGAVAEDADGNPIYDEVISHKNVTYVGIPAVFAGISLLALFLVLFWRRKIYFTAFIPGMERKVIVCNTQKDVIRKNGRFFFPKMSFGKHTFTIHLEGGKTLSLHLQLKRDSRMEGLQIKTADDTTIVIIGKDLKAIELHFQKMNDTYKLLPDCWAAIDRKHTVFTSDGKREPDKDGFNQTPDGLYVDKNHKIGFTK